MAYVLYNLLLLVLAPAALLYYLWRVFVSRKSRESWRANLGGLPLLRGRPADRKLIWMHAVSVGEVVASLPIQAELRRLMPDAVLLLTTITRTGNETAKRCSTADAISYLPLDYPLFVKRAFDRVRPDVLVLMEVEIWPNLLAEAKRRGVPVVLANGRTSDRSMRRAQAWRWLMSWAYSSIDYCLMQTGLDAERVRRCGARPEAVRVFGSTKFDEEGAHVEDGAVKAELGIPDDEQVFIAGSTNPGEDEAVLAAFKEMRDGPEKLRLVLAPRQIERAGEIEAMAEASGLKCIRRSEGETSARGWDVLIVDTLGELAKMYSAGDIAFVGGTLVPKGGHSLIQPILRGKPVLFGPYTFKTRNIAQMAISAGVGFEVSDAHDLAVQGEALLRDADHRARIELACARLVIENQGASARTAELIAGLLGA